MNAAQLLAHYDRVVEAPDAIGRLRRLVVDLAVRGKLLSQVPSEQSPEGALVAARVWLADEARKAGRVRWKPSEEIECDEALAVIPSGWVLARVNDTGFYINGLAFKPADWKSAGLPIIRIQNLTDASREFNYAQGEFPEEVIVQNGDILVSWSATLDAFRWNRGRGVLNQHIFRVIPAPGLTTSAYLLLLLRDAIREMADSEHAHGLVMTHINRGPFTSHLIRIPPLAEQHRIVAKVDELMALCDQLEVARAKREATRDRLTTATLMRLRTGEPQVSPDGREAETHPNQRDAQFALDALPEITSCLGQIKQFRRTILSLAVTGRLLRNGKGHMAKVGDFRRLQNGYAFKSSWFVKSGVRLLRNTNIGHDSVNWTEVACLAAEDAARFERFALQVGDVVLALDRPFISTGTKVARVQARDLPALLLQRVGRFEEVAAGLDDDYLFRWINSSEFNRQIDPGRSNGVPHISSKQVENAQIYVPSLGEQRRIVAKVDEMMAICDKLEAALASADHARSSLLDALLHEALRPAADKAA